MSAPLRPQNLLPNMTLAKPQLPREPISWPLLPLPSKTDGTMTYPSFAESLKQQIQIILLTGANQQLMQPRFGAGLADLLHEPNTLTTRTQIRTRIADSLALWEPRIAVDELSVEAGADPQEVRIVIAYHALRDGAADAVTLNVQLGAG